MPFGLLMMLYPWCVLAFFLSFQYLPWAIFYSCWVFYMSLKSVYSFLLDQNTLMIIKNYILYSSMFFKFFFKIIGPVVSSFFYQMSFLLYSFCINVIKFLKVLKISLVIFDLSSFFSPLKSIMIYFLSTFFVLNNMTKYASYFFIFLLDQLVKLISFSIVTMISLLMVLVVYTLMNHKVVLKFVIAFFFLGIILLVALGLVQLSFFLSLFGFLMWLLYNFMVTMKYIGNYFTSLFSSKVVMSSVSFFSFFVHSKDQTNLSMKPLTFFNTYVPYLFCTALLASNMLQYMISHVSSNWAWLATMDQVTWGLPTFMGLTGFNFSGFFYYVVKVFKKYSSPYTLYSYT